MALAAPVLLGTILADSGTGATKITLDGSILCILVIGICVDGRLRPVTMHISHPKPLPWGPGNWWYRTRS